MSQEQYTENLKVIVAEQLKGIENFTEDVNYVAEYIVLLIVNGGDVESIVKELSTLFDAISVDVLRDIVQTDFFALEALQQGESVDGIVSKIRELNAIQKQNQQQQQAAQVQESMQPPQPQPPQVQVQPVHVAPVPVPEQTQPVPQAQPIVSAFSGIVPQDSTIKNESDDVSMGNDVITPTNYQPRFSSSTRGGGVGRSRRGGRGGSTRGNRNHGHGNTGRFNPLAKALGMTAGGDDNNNGKHNNLNFVPTKKDGRCKLFPHCPLGRSCPHAHPTKVCNDYPNCPKPPGTCEFLHPNEDEELMKDIERTREEFQKRKAALLAARQKPVQTGLVICKFGILCSNPLCPFGHPTPANEDAKVIDLAWCPNNLKCEDKECRKAHSSLSKIRQVNGIGRPSNIVPGSSSGSSSTSPAAHGGPKPIEKSLEQCKYGSRCTNKRCKFRHARSPIMCRDGANCTRIDCLFGHPINEDCRFGINCRNATCLFRHPEGRVLPTKDQNGAGANTATAAPIFNFQQQQVPTNERMFALPEGSNIEQAPQQQQEFPQQQQQQQQQQQPSYQAPFTSQSQGGDMEMS